MIEGLKVTISGRDLQVICKSRANHHRERSSVYQDQINSMLVDRIEGMHYTNGDPVQSLKDTKSKHDGESSELDFIADHLDLSESYLLGQADLVKLGIVKSRY